MRKRYITGLRLGAIVLLSLLLLGLVASCASQQKPAQEQPAQQKPAQEQKPATQTKEPYVVGAVLDITGRASSLGVPERDTIQMVEEQVNAQGGINGRPLKVIIYDNESDETKAVLAIKKLIEEDKVPVVIGASTSGPSLAMLNTATKSQIPMVSVAASYKIVEPVNERYWIFKTAQSDSLMVGAVIEYLKRKGIKKVAFLNEANAYGDSGKVEFERLTKAAGIDVVAWERFGTQDTDMTPQLTKVKGLKPEAVVVWAIPPSASVVTKNYRDLKISAPLIHSHGIGNQDFIKQAGDAANGVIFPAGKLPVAEMLPNSDPQKSTLLKYKSDFKAKFNYDPSTFGGHAWDAIWIVIKALEKAGPDPAKIRDEIENMKGFVGITGTFDFSPQDHNGLGTDDVVYVTIKDGKWTVLAD